MTKNITKKRIAVPGHNSECEKLNQHTCPNSPNMRYCVANEEFVATNTLFQGFHIAKNATSVCTS